MYKIAILGCENSHANNFLNLISEGLYPEVEVIGVYSNEPNTAVALNEKYGVPVLSDYTDAVGKVDGVMITARHGDNHYKYAKPYMDSGIPIFIDKPITCAEAEAVEFMKEAREKGIRLCGGSTCAALTETLALAEAVKNEECGELRGGSLACPIQMNSPYGGFYFYAQHLVEIMMTVFGGGIKRIFANKVEDTVILTADYGCYSVHATYIERSHYYTVSVYGSKSSKSEVLTFNSGSFRHEMNDMLDLLNGEAMKKSYEDFIAPVFVINTIIRSMESGNWETVPQIVI